jgi:hypothetical protein
MHPDKTGKFFEGAKLLQFSFLARENEKVILKSS